MLAAMTRDGDPLPLTSAQVEGLRASLRGPLLHDGHPEYGEARTLWNSMIDKRPALVARCQGVADVVACVHFARETGIALSIKGGGHNISGLALGDGALTLDMSRMRGVMVDPDGRRAFAHPGCLLGDLDRETQLHGLAAVMGFVSATGITGLTLGGGFGYLTRRWGWTSDTLRSVEIVTADGAVLRASEERHPDLFWALRGGGGNFGVVTRLGYELYPVGPKVFGGAIAWRAEEADSVLELYREVSAEAPRELTLVAGLRFAPPAPWLPADVHGQPIALLLVCDTGPLEEAEARFARIRSFGNPVGNVVQVRPYVTQQCLLDATQPPGRRCYWKSEYLPAIEPALLPRLQQAAAGMPSPYSVLLLFPIGGALNELPEDHSAVGNRDARWVLNIASAWDRPEDDEANIGWTRRTWEDLRGFSTGGTYLNFLTQEEGDERIQQALRGNYARVARVKAAYDPDNLFRLNKNIRPSRTAAPA